ncbi:MAG: prolyl oligopeptidase family serine peptidase, partial [bacterium]
MPKLITSHPQLLHGKIYSIVITAITLVFAHLLFAQTPALKYQVPPKPLADIVDAPTTPSVSLDPTHEWMLLLEQPGLPSIEELAQPELRIAGLRINPRTNGRSRLRPYSGLRLKNIETSKESVISGLPDNARIRSVEWAPNGQHIAFISVEPEGESLWLASVASKSAGKLLDAKLNSAYGSAFEWHSDNQSLICKIVPADRGEAPAKPMVPSGPVVQETTGKKAPARTYQDLLKNPYDEALFAHYLSAEIVRVSIDGKVTKLGITGLLSSAEPSPDGKYLLVETIHKPFSYLVPARRFPQRVEVFDMAGKLVDEIADLPLAEEVPIGFGAVPTGPRSFGWRADAPSTLYWVEAQDGGNPRKKAEVRDKVFALKAPFSGTPRSLISLGTRYSGSMWGNANLALVTESWWRTRAVKIWRIKPDNANSAPVLLYDYSREDRYNDPGRPLRVRSVTGYYVLLTNNKGNKLYLTGSGASPEGDRPFLDEFDVNSKKTERLWRSEAPYYEYPIDLLDEKKVTVLTRRESKTEPPNYFIRDVKKNKLTQITEFKHPTPQLADIQKEVIKYQREDGVSLTATLYLPPSYKPEDGPLPMLMWAYPREFKSAAAAGQMRGSPHRFSRISYWSSAIWLAMGYAVLDNPAMPIIGEGDKEPNDTYVMQLVASAKAAVDEVVRRGVAEPGRIAIGGHSYGAFMTANLLAHSDLFAAGIARSGAYNRTLTPFGFQAEERTYWEAPEIYFAMSPFMHAQKVNEPILLIHGQADNNSGTFPIQSERYYHALKGHGAKARLVMLPYESHGYRSRESLMHMLWETNRWLEKYVKKSGEKQTMR